MNEEHNRPRVVWKNGKSVIIRPNTQTPKPKARTLTAPQPKPAQRPAPKVNNTGKKRTQTDTSAGFGEFLHGLRYKRSVIVAFLLIAALSVTAAIALPALFSHNDEQETDAYDTAQSSELNITVPEPINANSTWSEDVAVCIDPGHGYDDVGTSNDELGVYEHEVNLSVGLKLREKLEAAGVSVYMTHDTNEPPPDASEPYLFGMTKRNGLANSLSDVDLFISLHCDAFFEDTTVSGPRVYHMDYDLGGAEVANAISERIAVFEPDKEIQVREMSGYNSYQVLRDSNMPAVLVEMGFVSHPEEGAAMLTEEWIDAMADALAKAIEESFEDGVIGE
ncbi:MAG: N-acetylmuramoyl-L-alanine amidase [Clostridia bacterium]|nr:N-acetylmuramoyl-L-alanine amidase [Clostridia bacterium]